MGREKGNHQSLQSDSNFSKLMNAKTPVADTKCRSHSSSTLHTRTHTRFLAALENPRKTSNDYRDKMQRIF